jgi:hypothetical protein
MVLRIARQGIYIHRTEYPQGRFIARQLGPVKLL